MAYLVAAEVTPAPKGRGGSSARRLLWRWGEGRRLGLEQHLIWGEAWRDRGGCGPLTGWLVKRAVSRPPARRNISCGPYPSKKSRGRAVRPGLPAPLNSRPFKKKKLNSLRKGCVCGRQPNGTGTSQDYLVSCPNLAWFSAQLTHPHALVFFFQRVGQPDHSSVS